MEEIMPRYVNTFTHAENAKQCRKTRMRANVV